MDFVKEIKKLKEQKNAFICCHNFQRPEIHGVADAVGDSFELSRAAYYSGKDTIVACGVSFMAESIKLLCPEKKVLVPDASAKCLSKQCTAKDIRKARKKHPNASVLLYANCSPAAKTEADAVCTSWSALDSAKSMNDEIIFGSDKNVASFLESNSGKKIIRLKDSNSCPILDTITAGNVLKLKSKHPDALVIGHPECAKEILEISDIVGGTSTFIKAAKDKSPKSRKLIACTEAGIVFVMSKHAPKKEILAANPDAKCPEMQKNDLKKVYNALISGAPEVNIPKKILDKAHKTAIKQLLIAEEKIWKEKND